MGWVGTVIIARSLTQEEFGQFTLVFSLLGMLSIVTELGTGRVAISGVLDESGDPATFA
jgi:O-antigen/teichoic acid export membrane protein